MINLLQTVTLGVMLKILCIFGEDVNDELTGQQFHPEDHWKEIAPGKTTIQLQAQDWINHK